MQKNSILLALGVFAISVLCMFSFYTAPNVYALTVSASATFAANTPCYSAYVSSLDDVVTTTGANCGTFRQADGGTLASVATSAPTVTAFSAVGLHSEANSHALACSSTTCYQVGNSDTAPCTDCLTILAYNFVTHASLTFTDSTCIANPVSGGVFVSGANLYISLNPTAGSCDGTSTDTRKGLYTIATSAITSGDSTSSVHLYYEDSTFYLAQNICKVGDNMYGTQSSNLLRKSFTTGQLSTLALGHTPTSMSCDSTGGYIFTASTGTDNIKRVTLSTFTVTETASITDPYGLMARGDTLYVTRDTAAAFTITAFNKTLLSSSFAFYSNLDSIDAIFAIGNSTRFNVQATTNMYAFNGVFASDLFAGDNVPDATLCVDMNPNNDVNTDLICYTDTNGDGIADINQPFSSITGSSSVPVIANNIVCGINLGNMSYSDCVSSDIKDNGTGLLLMLVLGLFFSGILMLGAKKLNTSISDIHPAYWMFLVLGVTGASYKFGWIPSEVFFGLLVVCAGIGVFGFRKQILPSIGVGG